MCVILFQEFSLQESRISTILVKILHVLYDMDVLHEQVLFKWHRTIPQAEDVPERERLRKQVNIVLNDKKNLHNLRLKGNLFKSLIILLNL